MSHVSKHLAGHDSEIMLWKTLYPGRLDEWEPMELRVLKRKLAKLDSNCRCSFGANSPTTCTKESTSTLYQSDQNIQTLDYEDTISNYADKVTTCEICTCRVSPLNIFNKSALCPACFFTQNMLRVVPARILKDEEIETKPEMFSCDKSTSKTVHSLEAATSLTFKPVLKSSYLTFVNNNTETIIDLSQNRSSSHREVTFALDNKNQIPCNPNASDYNIYNSNQSTVEPINLPETCSYCACAKIIDAIRPRCSKFT